MRTRSGSLYSTGESAAAVVGHKRKRSASPSWSGQSAVAGECSGGGRRKRLAGGPDYLDELPDDLVLSILARVAASASAPSDLLSVHLTYVAASIHSFNQSAAYSSCANGLQTKRLFPLPVSVMRGAVGGRLQFVVAWEDVLLTG